MNSLVEGLESVIKNAIEEFAMSITSKYDNIDAKDLEELWNDVSQTMKISVTAKKVTRLPSKSSEATKESNSNSCPYKFIKGAKQDQLCGSKVKDGNVYCSRHKKYEGVEQKERKTTPIPKRGTIQASIKTKSRSPAKTTQRIIRKHKGLGKLWHPESGLVIRSHDERVVIGKIVNDKLVDLTEGDLDECRRWGFPFVHPNDAVLENEISSDTKKSKQNESVNVYLVADSSSPSGKKFWECTISGVNYTTRHGKVGNNGTTKTKVFDTHEDALNEMNRMVKNKTKKGYIKSKESVSNISTPSSPTSKKESKKKNKKDGKNKKSGKSEIGFNNSSDIENILDVLQGESPNISDEDTPIIAKDFISNALGIEKKLKKKVEVNDEEVNEEDEKMLIEEYEEVEEEVEE